MNLKNLFTRAAPSPPARALLHALPPKRGGDVAKRRSYSVASNAAFLSWSASDLSGNTILAAAFPQMRARCRDIARNNDYARHFLRLMKSNVIGDKGFRLRVKHYGDNALDRDFSNSIEKLWNSASKPKHSPTVCGSMSQRELAELWLHNLIVDGEVLEMFYPTFSRNKFRMASQIVDSSLLDWSKNDRLPNGNRVIIGVEVDDFGRHIAFHLRQNHTSDDWTPKPQRIPATHAKLTFIKEFAGQVRGVSWLASPAIRAQMLQKFEEALIIACRAAASKGGFYKTNEGYEGEPPGQREGEDGDDSQYFRETLEPGEWQQLPAGVEPVPYDPQFPGASIGEMTKTMLRSIASGLGISYHSMANNLEGVNYSSIRAGDLEQRGIYRAMQQFVIDHHEEIYFEHWAKNLLLLPQFGINSKKLQAVLAGENWVFLARGWDWIDPLKEVMAHKETLKLRLKSRSQIVAETTGDDFENVLDEIESEEAMMVARGIDPRIDVIKQDVTTPPDLAGD